MKRLIYLLLVLTMFSCKDDDSVVDPIVVNDSKVLILNEGNFNFGNASLSLYNQKLKSVNNKVFQSNNSGRPIGDVVQSTTQIGEELFVLVNNSSKIEILDVSNLSAKASIQQLNSPRYLTSFNSQKAYVSDLYEDKLYVINPESRSVVKTIETGGWVEEMAIVNNKLYLTHVDSNQLWVLNVSNDSILSKIDVHEQPQFIEVDANNNIWVSCTGGFNGGKSAIYKIDSSVDSILSVFEAPTVDFNVSEIEFNGSKNELHFLAKDGLYAMNVAAAQLPTVPKVSKENRLFYGFSIEPISNEIYISDAIDYQQRGVVYRFNNAGSQLDAFKVGIIPGDVVFLK